MANLKVIDNEYSDLKDIYLKIGEIAEEQLNTYFKSMENICSNSIASGLIYNNLLAFVIEAKKIKGVLDEITEALSTNSGEFVEKIDEKDKYIY